MTKSEMIGVWVTLEMKEKIETRSNKQGITPPEYIRNLVIQDLEKQ